ncbi:hypothetical protein [Pseudactinotalea sp.]|uniref:hypothetical protein n=1 Tax=Pseudactinotalea sp. TaxID=1926260 RepID=UPI003B3A5736
MSVLMDEETVVLDEPLHRGATRTPLPHNELGVKRLLGEFCVEPFDLVLEDAKQPDEITLLGIAGDLPTVGGMTDGEIRLHLLDDATRLGESILAEVALDSLMCHPRTISGVS